MLRWFHFAAFLLLSCASLADNVTFLRIDKSLVEQRVQQQPQSPEQRVTTLRAMFEKAGCAKPNIQVQTVPDQSLPNVICTPHVAGSTAEAQEELGIQVAVQVKDYLAEGVIRNAVNLPALSPEQYKRVQPYLALAQQLGSLVSQAAATRPARIKIRYAGELAELGTHLLRNAVLAGLLNAVLDEKVNVVNAPAVAASRGLTVEEETRRRERGFPHTLEVAALPGEAGGTGFSAEGTVLHDGTPRVIQIDGIPLEAQLDGTILYIRNHDEPGVIGFVGMTLGKHGVNIATFALGRREANRGAEAVSLVRLDGKVSEEILEPLKQHTAIRQAKLIHLV